MDKIDLSIYLLVSVLLIITSLAVGFVMGYYANDEVCIKEKVPECPEMDLDVCLEHVKSADVFQKELYNKEWLS